MPSQRRDRVGSAAAVTSSGTPLVVEDLSVSFPLPRTRLLGRRAMLNAVKGVSFHVDESETLAIVGESGSGKSTTARAILRLEQAEAGSVLIGGVDWRGLTGKQLRTHRHDAQMVFQDPYSSLDPSMTVGHALAQPLLRGGRVPMDELRRQVGQALTRVGLDPWHASRYPHEFSGGQRQRIAIARALASDPKVLICDEAVSALDVSTQNHILNLLKDLQAETGVAILFIAHDLSIVRHVSQRVAVMYLGAIVEIGSVKSVFESPSHPYTKALLEAAPIPDPRLQRARKRTRVVGESKVVDSLTSGCPYARRCPDRMPICDEVDPVPIQLRSGVEVRCHLHGSTSEAASELAARGPRTP